MTPAGWTIHREPCLVAAHAPRAPVNPYREPPVAHGDRCIHELVLVAHRPSTLGWRDLGMLGYLLAGASVASVVLGNLAAAALLVPALALVALTAWPHPVATIRADGYRLRVEGRHRLELRRTAIAAIDAVGEQVRVREHGGREHLVVETRAAAALATTLRAHLGIA